MNPVSPYPPKSRWMAIPRAGDGGTAYDYSYYSGEVKIGIEEAKDDRSLLSILPFGGDRLTFRFHFRNRMKREGLRLNLQSIWLSASHCGAGDRTRPARYRGASREGVWVEIDEDSPAALALGRRNVPEELSEREFDLQFGLPRDARRIILCFDQAVFRTGGRSVEIAPLELRRGTP